MRCADPWRPSPLYGRDGNRLVKRRLLLTVLLVGPAPSSRSRSYVAWRPRQLHVSRPGRVELEARSSPLAASTSWSSRRSTRCARTGCPSTSRPSFRTPSSSRCSLRRRDRLLREKVFAMSAVGAVVIGLRAPGHAGQRLCRARDPDREAVPRGPLDPRRRVRGARRRGDVAGDEAAHQGEHLRRACRTTSISKEAIVNYSEPVLPDAPRRSRSAPPTTSRRTK